MADIELTTTELRIALMWEKGMDTWDMVREFNRDRKNRQSLTEADIYNMLLMVRAKRMLRENRP